MRKLQYVIKICQKHHSIKLVHTFKFQKWPYFDYLWSFFWQLLEDLSQNCGSDGHFEMLSMSKS